VTAAVAKVVERSVAPSVMARGGAVHIASVRDGVVTLEASGSPGAVLPAAPLIEALLCAAVPEVTAVKIVWPGHGVSSDEMPGRLETRIQRVLDDEVNPAIAAHGGQVQLVDVDAGCVRIRLEGGCQGCNLAVVTVRQGIEPLLRTRLPDVVAVLDVTDHAAGTTPFFSPSKR
jgi:Fe-S cluster biogenesis protein NfuA